MISKTILNQNNYNIKYDSSHIIKAYLHSTLYATIEVSAHIGKYRVDVEFRDKAQKSYSSGINYDLDSPEIAESMGKQIIYKTLEAQR